MQKANSRLVYFYSGFIGHGCVSVLFPMMILYVSVFVFVLLHLCSLYVLECFFLGPVFGFALGHGYKLTRVL